MVYLTERVNKYTKQTKCVLCCRLYNHVYMLISPFCYWVQTTNALCRTVSEVGITCGPTIQLLVCDTSKVKHA